MFTRFKATLVKESLLILRDREAMLLLFVMPLAFVLIMSLALREPFNERAGIKMPLLVVNQDGGVVGAKLVEHFANSRNFSATVHREPLASMDDDLRKGSYRFAIVIPPDMTARAVRRIQQQIGETAAKQPIEPPIEVTIFADPTVRGDQRALMAASINRALQAIETGIVLKQIDEMGKRLARARQMFPEIPMVRGPAALNTFVDVPSAPPVGTARRAPSSTQQHVPSWTLLAMFFLVIPLSIAFIKEREQGSLQRLRSLAVSPWLLIGGKTVPYFVINQVQMALMLLAGVYLLPRVGGEALAMGNSVGGIALISIGASLAAIGYGFLISSFARTTEQATIFGPVSVLILAGIGGVLVPRMFLPPLMQDIGMLSPFAWALEGFFDVFLREGGVREVLPRVAALLVFGLSCFGVAIWRFRRQFRGE